MTKLYSKFRNSKWSLIILIILVIITTTISVMIQRSSSSSSSPSCQCQCKTNTTVIEWGYENCLATSTEMNDNPQIVSDYITQDINNIIVAGTPAQRCNTGYVGSITILDTLPLDMDELVIQLRPTRPYTSNEDMTANFTFVNRSLNTSVRITGVMYDNNRLTKSVPIYAAKKGSDGEITNYSVTINF